MIEYLRRFLIAIRKESNRTDLKPTFEIRLIIGILIGAIIGATLDILIPYNFFLNMIRGIIANLVGFSMFSVAYVTNTKLRRAKIAKDQFYNPLRKRFSHKQRINLSILGGVVVVILVILGNKESPVYTLKASLAIASILILVTFSRAGRNEFIKNIYDLPDTKDLEFMTNRKNKQIEELNSLKDKKNAKISNVEQKFNKISKSKGKL